MMPRVITHKFSTGAADHNIWNRDNVQTSVPLQRMTTSSSKACRAATLSLLTVAAIGPVLYPLWLAWRTRGLPDPEPPEPASWPDLTVVVPAFREQRVIAAKVENLLENGYPGQLELIVVADDEETATTARTTSARVIAPPERIGKAAALNLGVRSAKTEIVAITDANAMIDVGGLEKLIRWFDDPTVGAVAGEKRIDTTSGESTYWMFESWLKRRESRTGTTIGLIGELAAFRRKEYVELPEDLAVDDLWLALDVVEHGGRIAYEPEAGASEAESATTADEWERRTRIVSGANDVLWRRRRLLVPGSSPVAIQLWGHRLFRQSLGPLAHSGLVLIALVSVRKSRLARGFLALHALGVRSLVRQQHGRPSGRLGRLAAQVLFLQAVGIGGTVRWARGDRPARWPKPERVLRARDGADEPNSPPRSRPMAL